MKDFFWYIVRFPFRIFFFWNIFKIIKKKGARSIPKWMREKGAQMLEDEWIYEAEPEPIKK